MNKYSAKVEMQIYGDIYSVLKQSDHPNKQMLLDFIKLKANILRTNRNKYAAGVREHLIKKYGEQAKVDELEFMENACVD